jgi:hypothetical protein
MRRFRRFLILVIGFAPLVAALGLVLLAWSVLGRH